jgi:toxin ParE1/3/4
LNYYVKILPSAIEDLQQIYNYIAYELQSIINAENQLNRIQEEISKLDFMPESFRLYEKEPWKSRGLRFFSVDNYIVFYVINNNAKEVNVLRVLYGRIDFLKIWN